MTVGEVCTREVVITEPAATATVAALLMRTRQVGAAVAVEKCEGRPLPIGILADRDLVVNLLAVKGDPGTTAIGELVSRPPVTDSRGSLVGILTGDDWGDGIAEQLSALARLIGLEQDQERRRHG